MLRERDVWTLDPRVIPRWEGTSSPFWRPDSPELGFRLEKGQDRARAGRARWRTQSGAESTGFQPVVMFNILQLADCTMPRLP